MQRAAKEREPTRRRGAHLSLLTLCVHSPGTISLSRYLRSSHTQDTARAASGGALRHKQPVVCTSQISDLKNSEAQNIEKGCGSAHRKHVQTPPTCKSNDRFVNSTCIRHQTLWRESVHCSFHLDVLLGQRPHGRQRDVDGDLIDEEEEGGSERNAARGARVRMLPSWRSSRLPRTRTWRCWSKRRQGTGAQNQRLISLLSLPQLRPPYSGQPTEEENE